MADLTSLLSQLDVFSAKESHKEVRDTALRILEQKPTAATLKHALVACISLDNYPEAFNLIVDHLALVGANEESLKLELAYVYYKCGKSYDLERLRASVSPCEGLNHILAQFYYRNGQETEALKLYRELSAQEDADDDVSVNERAVIAQLRSRGVKTEASSPALGSYDEVFNESLIDAVDGDYKTALSKLEKAKSLVEASTELSSDEKHAEVLPIEIQRAYVLTLQGETDKATAILESLSTNDKAVDLVLKNNLMALKPIGDFEPTLLYRELNFPHSVANNAQKLSYLQEQTLKRNEQLMAKLARKSINPTGFNLKFKYSGLPEALSEVDDLAAVSHKSLGRLAMAKANVGLSLLAAQLAISKGNAMYAALVLESLTEANPQTLALPGVGKTLCTLYETLEQKTKLGAVLSSIHETLSIAEVDIHLESYAIYVALKLMSTHEAKAKALLEKYNKGDITSVKFTRGDVEALTAGIDCEALAKAGIAPLLKDTSKVTKPRKTTRRQKPRHMPANANGKPDPERWLPLKDRSNYKPKRGKRDTQGA